jgi:hypothetical protein
MKRIDYNHKNFGKIQRDVATRFSIDFNQIQLDVVEKYYDNMLFEYIQTPSFKVLCDEWLDNYPDVHFSKRTPAVYNWLEQTYDSKILDNFRESDHYPMWSTLFEAKHGYFGEKLDALVDELYEIGIGVIAAKGSLDTMLFLTGAGYDFYQAHWIPMYQQLGYIDEKLLEEVA